MKNRILVILVLVLLFSFFTKNVLASELCSLKGYSIFTINGIFTNEDGAVLNKNNLKRSLPPIQNNQSIIVNYLYNPTHLGGFGDLIDAVQQGLFDQKSDYDLVEMLNDASKKVTTQKLLLVGHSQGNFYANNFYDKTASQEGGVPKESIGVYSVATPADHVGGGGKYLTSDTDNVIASEVARFIKILPPNISIPLSSGADGNGHSFSEVYLKYQGNKIVSDIKSSLDKLQENDEQEAQAPCISPPKLTILHKVEGAALGTADFAINNTNKAVVYVANGVRNAGLAIGSGLYNAGLAVRNIFSGLTANVVGGLPDTGSLAAVSPEVLSYEEEQTKNNSTPVISEISNNPISSEIENGNQTVETNPTISSAPVSPRIVLLPGRGGAAAPSLPPTSPAPAEEETSSAPPVTPPATPPAEEEIVSEPPTTPPAPDENPPAEEENPPAEPLATPPEEETPPPPTPPVPPAPPVVDSTAPVITILGNNPEILTTGSSYIEAGATALDEIDGAREVVVSGEVNADQIGNYTITYTASDVAGNTKTATREVKVASYKYIPKYKFGSYNGDGHDWQVWAFNGSNIYDWSDSYVNNYLLEQFKLQTYRGGYWCSACLERGIFKHDPRKGFERSDKTVSNLENSPQNRMTDAVYDVAIQWDSTGYTYTISRDSVIDSTGHTEVANMNNDLWVGWDSSTNSFLTFPYGTWQDKTHDSPEDRRGGGTMILEPFPVYKDQSTSAISTLSLPAVGSHRVDGIDPTRGRTNLTPFTFQIIFTDKNNNAPQNVKLHVINRGTGVPLSEGEMQKVTPGADVLSDGNFVNGESYITDGTSYDTGDYNYYFTANDSAGNALRLPESEMFYFGVIPSTYTYIPKYKFGNDNGDGHDWQVWSFNGSNVYDWSDTYVNYYLKEQFKIQAYSGGYWCSNCLQRGVFNHDPQKGFELTDLSVSNLENSPQNKMDGVTYDVVIQWDSAGYTYTISHDSIIDFTGHTDVAKINNNFWVGWNSSTNNFQTFPYGTWQDAVYAFPGRAGGNSMVLQPYPIYDPTQVSPPSPDPIPEPDPTSDPTPDPAPDPTPDPTSEITSPSITSYVFGGIAGDITGNPPVSPISMVFTANKEVDWVSVKIEKENNASDLSVYKYYYPGDDCDKKNTCTQNWDGKLTGELLQNNTTYKVKVRIRDLVSGNEEDFFSPYKINVVY